MLDVHHQSPLATGRIDFHVWLHKRPNGEEYLVIDLGPVGRFTADVNPRPTSGRLGRGIPYATGQGITVWKAERHGDQPRTMLQIKSHRFRAPFRAYLNARPVRGAAPEVE
jgi:hypothetical protein